ncbi:NTP transferase domain-containing protein [Microbacterium sp. NPDC087665]|uniref:NTP transferase domain-containing protein n=1 Tax=Microbacterium sp. NPDC087665 TaxID=3364194 RepID=UPI003824B02D
MVPAAGRGTRLGADLPKILVPVARGHRVWHLLHESLSTVADHVHVVLSPDGETLFRDLAMSEIASGLVSTGVQPIPIGMGDAVFRDAESWSADDDILVVWGDQVNLRATTLVRTVEAHRDGTGPRLTMPVVRPAAPYVEYVFHDSSLVAVKQSREGDSCRPGGISDVGAFLLTAEGLKEAWQTYLDRIRDDELGQLTGEVNFLPFLAYLSRDLGWAVTTVEAVDQVEARGVNTPEDLEFARRSLI